MFVRAEISCSQTFKVGFVEGMEFQELSPSNEKWEGSVAPRTSQLWSFSHSGTGLRRVFARRFYFYSQLRRIRVFRASGPSRRF